MDRDKFARKGHAYKHDDLTISESNIHPKLRGEVWRFGGVVDGENGSI